MPRRWSRLARGADFLYTDGIRDLDAAAAKLLFAPEARQILALASALLRWKPPTGRGLPWRPPPGPMPGATGLQLGQVAQPLAGRFDRPGLLAPALFEMLSLLGQGQIPYPIKGLYRLDKFRA